MVKDMRRLTILFGFFLAFGLLGSIGALNTSAQVQSATPTIDNATGEALVDLSEQSGGMTLYQLMEAGGWIVIVLIGLSVIALALVIYFSFTMTQRKMIPRDMTVQIRHYLHEHRYEDIVRLCRRSKSMFSKIILAGIVEGAEDPMSAASTMEAVGRREAETMMRKVRYLSDISTISPMLGILGTVLGMINAFNFIAFEISTVKPVALASAVAQALVTTAAGLIVAIPSMGFYFYFRGKLQSRISEMEEIAIEVSDHLMKLDREPESAPRRTRRKTVAKDSHAHGRTSEEI